MNLLRWSDWTLLFSIQSDGGSASDQAKVIKAVRTRLWLRLVGVHRMRPVVILGVLDLSGIDRTLGGSVWSLPPERPVSRYREGFQLFSISFPITLGATI